MEAKRTNLNYSIASAVSTTGQSTYAEISGSSRRDGPIGSCLRG